jgi:hypothetical protein
MELSVIRTRVEREALEQLARKLLAIRDLTNTPVQTIELTSAVLRMHHPDLKPQLDRLDRALAQLHQLNELLEGVQSSARWSPALESFDAREHLK